jgi:hypothetical protein
LCVKIKPRKIRVGVRVMVFNDTFNNISIISWQLVLLMKETRISRENHRPAPIYLKTLEISSNLFVPP